jgi:hypothetical protein
MGRVGEQARGVSRGLELGQREQAFREKAMGERGKRYARGLKAGAEREEAGREFASEEAQSYRTWTREQRHELNLYEERRFQEFENELAQSASPRGWSNFLQLAGTVIGAAYGNAGLGSMLGGAIGRAATGYSPSGGAQAVSGVAGAVVGGARAASQGRELDVQARSRGLRMQSELDVVDPRTEFRPVQTAQPGMYGYEVVPHYQQRPS